MKLYIHPFSNHARKCRAVARELALEVEEITVDLMRGETRTPEFRAINPAGKLPALVDGDLHLAESNAILLHFAQKKPGPLLPEGDARSLVYQWLFFESAELATPYLTAARERLIKPMMGLPGDEELVQKTLPSLTRATKTLERALEGKTWILGDQLSLADFAIACQTSAGIPAKIDLSPYPNVSRHLAQMNELPSFRDAAR